MFITGSFLFSFPRGVGQGLGQKFFDLPLQAPVVLDSALTFLGHFFADRFGRSFALQSSGPAIIDPVELGRVFFARAMGLATGAGGGGDAARQQRDRHSQDNYFFFFCLHPNVYLH